MSSTYARVRQHAVSWLSRALTLGLQVIIMRVLTSQWDVEVFGYYLYLVAMVATGTLFDMGLTVAVKNRLSQLKAHHHDTAEVYASIVPLTIVLGLAFFALGSAIVTALLHYGFIAIPYPYWMLAVAILFGLSHVFLTAVYSEGNGEFAYYAQSIFLSAFLVGISAYFYLLRPSAPPSSTSLLFFYYALFISANISIGCWKGGRRAVRLWEPPWGEIKILARRSLGFWAYSGIGFFITQVDVIILGFVGAFTALTYYIVMNKIFFGACYTFLSVYLSLTHPKITVAWEQGDTKLTFHYLKRMITGGVAMALAFTLSFEGIKGWLIGILITHPDETILQEAWVYCFYLFFITRIVSDCCLTFLMALSKVKRINTISLAQGALSALLQISFVQWWGIEGVVIALWGSYLFSAAFFVFSLVRLHKREKGYVSAMP